MLGLKLNVIFITRIDLRIISTTNPGVVAEYRHSASVPTAPRNVTVRPERPSSVLVSWLAPARPHGRPADLRYTVEWSTLNADGSQSEGSVRVGSGRGAGTSRRGGRVTQTVGNLQAAHPYNIRVRNI